jgi:hypothetical protein
LAGGLNSYGFGAGDPINFSDPFGLCVQVRQSGKDIELSFNLRFSGSWSAADQTAVKDGITAAWSGSRGGYNVSVKIGGEGPFINVSYSADQKAWGGSAGLEDGVPLGGAIMIPMGVSGSRLSGVAGHEFGHAIGIRGNSMQSRNLMSDPWQPGNTGVNRVQMREMLANCTPQSDERGESEETQQPPTSGKEGK